MAATRIMGLLRVCRQTTKHRDRSKRILSRLLTHDGAMSADAVTSRKKASSTQNSQNIFPSKGGYLTVHHSLHRQLCVLVYNKNIHRAQEEKESGPPSAFTSQLASMHIYLKPDCFTKPRSYSTQSYQHPTQPVSLTQVCLSILR